MNWLWNLLRRFVALLNPFALVQKLRPAPSPEEADPDLARALGHVYRRELALMRTMPDDDIGIFSLN